MALFSSADMGLLLPRGLLLEQDTTFRLPMLAITVAKTPWSFCPATFEAQPCRWHEGRPGRLRHQAPAREGMVADGRPEPRRTPARYSGEITGRPLLQYGWCSVHWPDIAACIALGKRVSKSRMLTHSGRTVMRTIWGDICRTPSTHSRPCSSPKYRSAQAAYSGVTPSTLSTSAVPRT